MGAHSEISADDIIICLGLRPHPEGGYYAETWRELAAPGQRAAGTAIYFLLRAGERSHWHRIDATEIWHYYAGAPLSLHIAASDTTAPTTHHLGPDLSQGERPQLHVPPHAWQAAESHGEWTLVGCTVSPAFQFEHFELAEPDFRPGPHNPAPESG